MIETLVALACAHALADFVFQTNWIIRRKRQPLILLLHVGIVLAASWVALGFAPVWGPLALLALSHLAFDAAKLRWGGPGFAAFTLDQAGHLAILLLIADWRPEAYAEGLWARLAAGPLPSLALLPEAMALTAGLVFAVLAGGHAVAALMTAVQLPSSSLDSLPRGGRMIGKLERLLILMLVLAGQPDGIGFLIAAKSILRFNELAGQPDRHVSEYVIIGTLASYAWAIGFGYAARAALQALGAAPGG